MDQAADSVNSNEVPGHVAIIMDGNGRWANARGLDRLQGHEAGTETIRRVLRHAAKRGVQYLTIWAFSTENWRRPEDEVSGLMEILGRVLISETEELHRQGAQLRHIGDLTPLAPHLQESIKEAIELTANNDRIVLTIAFNYGGRQELIHAMKRMIADGIDPDSITEETVCAYLYMPDLPEPDLIIRTSGEYRLSNFLLWQGAYSELFFSPKYWPDFSEDDLDEAISNYTHRERRFGATSAQIRAT